MEIGLAPIATSLSTGFCSAGILLAIFLFLPMKSRIALFRTLKTGIAGSAMPSLDGGITDEQIWELADYLAHD